MIHGDCTCGDESKKWASEEEMFCVTLRTGYRFGTCTASCRVNKSKVWEMGGNFDEDLHGGVTVKYPCPKNALGWKKKIGSQMDCSGVDSYENSLEYQLCVNPCLNNCLLI